MRAQIIDGNHKLGEAPLTAMPSGQTVKTREPALAEGAGGGTIPGGGRRPSNTGGASGSPTTPSGGGFSADDDDLQARLDRLRQG